MGLDRLAHELGDRDVLLFGRMAKPGVEIIGQLHCRPLHGMPAYRARTLGHGIRRLALRDVAPVT